MPEKTTPQPERGLDAFADRFTSLLYEDIERLYELELDMMKEDIAQGWRCFYAGEIWREKHLPPPLINDAGKAVNLENLRRIVRHGQHISWVKPDPRGYRNYLDVGDPDLGGDGGGEWGPWDLVANEVATRLLQDEHRFMPCEIDRDREQWYAEAAASGTLTPPRLIVELDLEPPVRTEAVPLHADIPYWCAMYPTTHRAVMDTEHFHAYTKPGYVVGLMAQLAPDFPYDAKRGTSKSLFFPRADERDVQWAVWIDKTDGSPEYRYPPQLALILRWDKKVRKEYILYVHHGLKMFVGSVSTPRDIEIQLRFHLARIRKHIAFLDPFVDAALSLQPLQEN
jgi:hypothetical protein